MVFSGKKWKCWKFLFGHPPFFWQNSIHVFKIQKNWPVLMYNEGFTSLKHKNYVEGKQNKYGCHGN
jgi:hypothetical protein